MTTKTILLLADEKALRAELKRRDINVPKILFCFGNSFISHLIQAKTQVNRKERVPSHVAMIYGSYVYESTTDEAKVNKKRIPKGVRRWQLKDFLKNEKKKDTQYYLVDYPNMDYNKMEDNIHRPYGIDYILDYMLKDGSDGDGDGLICSQYCNIVCNIIPDRECVTPAELFRKLCY